MALDSVLALVFCVVDVTLFSDLLSTDGVPADRGAPAVVVLAYAAVGFGALIWRRRRPVSVFIVLWLHSMVATQLPLTGYRPTVGVVVAVYAVAAYSDRLRSLSALAASLVPEGLAVAEEARRTPVATRTPTILVNAAFYAVLGLTVWGIGRRARASRRHAGDLERRRQIAGREAVAAERRRIARELHDIVANAITVIVLQASGARQVLDTEPRLAGDALDAITDLGGQAMDELRRLLLVLKTDPSGDLQAPHQFGFDQLDDLVTTMRRGGLAVHLRVHGAPRRLARSVDSTVYRLVAEALTNVVKHAGPGADTTVDLTWTPGELTVHVADDGPLTPNPEPARWSTSLGLIGLSERVDLVGGRFSAGPRDPRGFHVTAILPAGTELGRPASEPAASEPAASEPAVVVSMRGR